MKVSYSASSCSVMERCSYSAAFWSESLAAAAELIAHLPALPAGLGILKKHFVVKG